MQRTQNRLRGSKNKRDLLPKLTWTGRKFKKFLQCESIQISGDLRDRARYEEDLLRESHVQKIGGKILEKNVFCDFFWI
jgi:hypothetical protein